MDEPVGIWCGPDTPPKGKRRDYRIFLNSVGSNNNVNLKLSSIARKLARNLPPVLVDLLEIAAYVYSGDQCVTRGGAALAQEGALWRREFSYHIPVRKPELWKRPAIQAALVDLLTFMSDDYYDFDFRRLTREVPTERYFEFDDGAPWFEADEIMLYSGGLDSFAGLCEAVLGEKKKVVLVSHRPAPQTFSVQRQLLEDFEEQTNKKKHWLHVPVLVNKAERLTKDTHQRTRSFLYSCMAAALAVMHNRNRIVFCENGITSSNLIASPSTKGARASRTTHPKSLKGMANLLSLVFDRQFAVDNPFFWKTKADIVQTIKDRGMQGLIRHTISCSHVRSGDKINNHCGVCSQCIGRRLATVFQGLESDDPEEMYKAQLPLDPIPDDTERSMVELLVKTGRDYDQLDLNGFYGLYPMATSIVTSLDGRTDDNALKLYKLHKQHGQEICAVMEKYVGAHRGRIARGDVAPNSLLSMILGGPAAAKGKSAAGRTWPLPEDATWENITIEIVGLDAAKIIVGEDMHAATAAEMGFEDKKKRAPNQLWHLLVDLAEANGSLRWDTPARSKDWTSTDFRRLRKSLKQYFRLDDDPFQPYDRKSGYVTRFTILYDHTVQV